MLSKTNNLSRLQNYLDYVGLSNETINRHHISSPYRVHARMFALARWFYMGCVYCAVCGGCRRVLFDWREEVKKLALHSGYNVRIVEVKETPKFYIYDDRVKFRKIENPTPKRVGELYSNRSGFNGYTLSEINSELVQTKLAWAKQKEVTQDIVRAISEKFEYNSWQPEAMQHLTNEQAKHLNEYLELGLEIKE